MKYWQYRFFIFYGFFSINYRQNFEIWVIHCNALVNMNPKATHIHTLGILIFDKVPTLICTYLSDTSLSPYPRGCESLILNVRSAPESEQHCHNPLGGDVRNLSESLGVPVGKRLGIHTDCCISSKYQAMFGRRV